MSPITIAFVLLAAGWAFYSFLSFLTVFSKSKKENLLRKLCQENAANNLIFCSQEILQKKVMGVDGIHRKIMILEKIKNAYQCSTISLDEVRNCHLVTHSGSLKRGNNKRLYYNQATTLELRFEFNNHSQPTSIIFCNGLINSGRELAFVKAKAEYWCVMFSKMLNMQVEARA